MYQVIYGNAKGYEYSGEIRSIKDARHYAKEVMKDPGITEAVISKQHPYREGSDFIEYYDLNGHFYL